MRLSLGVSDLAGFSCCCCISEIWTGWCCRRCWAVLTLWLDGSDLVFAVVVIQMKYCCCGCVDLICYCSCCFWLGCCCFSDDLLLLWLGGSDLAVVLLVSLGGSDLAVVTFRWRNVAEVGWIWSGCCSCCFNECSDLDVVVFQMTYWYCCWLDLI